MHEGFEFVEIERAVVESRGKAETVFDEGLFAGAIAAEHAADLGDGDVAFVDDDEEIVGKIVDEAGRRFAGGASGEMARVIFDA